MAGRAWREAIRATNLDTSDKIFVPLLSQAFFAFVIWFAWNAAAQPPALLTRLMTAAVPFLITPILFAVKWCALPPALAREMAERARPDPEAERRQRDVAAFVANADRDNKLKAIDDIRAFHAGEIEPLRHDMVALRSKLSGNHPSATPHEIEQSKARILDLYRKLHALTDRNRQYEALAFTLSSPPGKEQLFRDVELLKLALQSGSTPLVHHHHNGLYAWLQDFEDWWRKVDAEMLSLRAQLSGG